MNTRNYFKFKGRALILYLWRPDYPEQVKVTEVQLNSDTEIVSSQEVEPTLTFKFEHDGRSPD